MARGDRPEGEAPEPLARLLARSDAVMRELERARSRLDDLEERLDADEPLVPDAVPTPGVDEPDPGTEVVEATGASEASDDEDLRPIPAAEVIEVPEVDPPAGRDGPSRDRDIWMLQEAARRRLSDER
jgi:hypothetical protein